MKKEEYQLKMKQASLDYEAQRQNIMLEYSKSRVMFNVGDVVKDHIGDLIVEQIKHQLYEDNPQPVYFGKRLTKKGEPIKRGDHLPAYHQNII